MLHQRAHRRLIMIAHHGVEPVENCDRLFFLKDGRLDATGTYYDDLLETSGSFRQMAAV